MRAWIFQDRKQLAKLGDACPWSVGWYDPDGKRKSKSIGSKSAAQKHQRKTEGQLAAGTYETTSRATWEQFTTVFESRVLAGMKPGTKDATQYALNHFERISKPGKVRTITTATVADYIATRRKERIRKAEDAPLVSVATVNKELRTLRAVFRKAAKWGYLPRVPEFDFLKEQGKLPTYVSPEDFAKIYGAGCKVARWPERQSFAPADWWRGLLMFGYMTGWRIGSILALRWEDVDLDKGQALSKAENNKGGRDQLVPLHPVVVDHLRKLRSFSPLVFPWDRGRRTLYTAWEEILTAAKVTHYGFHDLRRAFATMNAEGLTADALQTLMQHRDYQTTQRYISMARQLKPAVHNLFVPKLPTIAAVGG
jgi:Site-specific recombinase XerD